MNSHVPKLSQAENDILTTNFTVEKVYEEIMNMEKNKALMVWC
jgi:hypothetical protein